MKNNNIIPAILGLAVVSVGVYYVFKYHPELITGYNTNDLEKINQTYSDINTTYSKEEQAVANEQAYLQTHPTQSNWQETLFNDVDSIRGFVLPAAMLLI